MSLGIVFKGPEGIVFAADSRVTLDPKVSDGKQNMLLPATFNATKLWRVNGHDYVAAVTYGLEALGAEQPRTAHSFIPEFEASLKAKNLEAGQSVDEFAHEFSRFFLDQWKSMMPENYSGSEMEFVIGGGPPGARQAPQPPEASCRLSPNNCDSLRPL